MTPRPLSTLALNRGRSRHPTAPNLNMFRIDYFLCPPKYLLQTDIERRYKIGKELGSGNFAVVKLATRRDS